MTTEIECYSCDGEGWDIWGGNPDKDCTVCNGRGTLPMNEKIWCLFSIDNNYDQPEHNLWCWWRSKPSIEVLAKFLGVTMISASNEDIVTVVSLWQGNRCKFENLTQTTYFMKEVTEGERLG